MTTTYDADLVEARRDLRFEITVDSGSEDVYTWALSHAFDVLELMTLIGVPVPAEYDFRPTPGLTWEGFTESAMADLLAAAWASIVETYGRAVADEALAYWARVLVRYLGLPAVAALAD